MNEEVTKSFVAEAMVIASRKIDLHALAMNLYLLIGDTCSYL